MRAIDADRLIGQIKAEDFKDPADWWRILDLIDDAPTLTSIPKPKKDPKPMGRPRTCRPVNSDVIRQIMRAKGIKTGALSREIGYSDYHVGRCLNQRMMSGEMILGVARTLGVDPKEIEDFAIAVTKKHFPEETE